MGGIEQFEIAADRFVDACGFRRLCVGRVGIDQLALGALGPQRPWRGGGEAAQHLGLFRHRFQPQIGLGEFLLHAGERANPDDGLAADGAAHRLDGVAVRGREIEQKALPGLAQRVDCMVHLQRRLRRQPGSKGEDALRRVLLQHQRGVAGNTRAVAARRPGDQDLRFRKQQRLVGIGLRLQVADVGAELGFGPCRPDAVVHQQDRRHHGKTEQGECGGEHRHFLPIEVEQRGDQAERRVGGERRGGEGRGKCGQAVP